MPGTCPYDCHDTRCKAYFQGYCGTAIDTLAILTNINNPYDSNGRRHNQGVKTILPNVNVISNNLDSIVLINDKSFISTIGYRPDSLQAFYNREVVAGLFRFQNFLNLIP